jgi:Family of unknown function (DUF6152)
MMPIKMFASVVTVAALLITVMAPVSVAVSAQTPLGDYYDTTKPFTVKGTLRAMWLSPGAVPAMLLVEAANPASGTVTKWLIAGKSGAAMQRAGLFLIGPNAAIKSGDVITVTAYVAKPGSNAAEAIATALESAAPPGMKAGFVDELRQKDAKVLHGIEIITSDGKTLAIGETP